MLDSVVFVSYTKTTNNGTEEVMVQFQLVEFGTVDQTITPESPTEFFKHDNRVLHDVIEYMHRDVAHILFENADMRVRIVFPDARYRVLEPQFEMQETGSTDWVVIAAEVIVHYYDICGFTADTLEQFVEELSEV